MVLFTKHFFLNITQLTHLTQLPLLPPTESAPDASSIDMLHQMSIASYEGRCGTHYFPSTLV